MVGGPSRRDAIAFAAALASGLALGGVSTVRGEGKPALFRRGVNAWPWFSLTREYPAPRTDYAWPPLQETRAIPTRDDLQRLRAAGFDFIRLPVDPGPMLDASAGHRRILLARVIAAVRDAQAAGLGVVVNLQLNDATHFWRSQNLIASTGAPRFAAYRDLVGVVARALADLKTDHLALEPVNEPPQDCTSSAWTEVQIALLTTARRSAPYLTLVATGACGSMVRGLDALDPKPLEGLQPLLFTFHFYEPYLFSHQGAPWMREPVYRSLNAVPWPGSAGSLDATLAAVRARMDGDGGLPAGAEKEAYAITERLMRQYFEANPDHRLIDRYLDVIAAWGDRYGIGHDAIIMGEFGAVKTTGRIVAAHDGDRVRYIKDVREAAEARGFGWAFWNLFDSMGLMDDTTRVIDANVIGALGLRMPP